METANDKKTGGHKTITINRSFNQPLKKIWEAWTEPETFKKWWGPRNYSCPDCTINLKPGGTFHASMLNKKTGQKTWSLCTYKEIVPSQKLVYRDNWADEDGNIIPSPVAMPGDWSKEQIVTLTFKETNGKAELTLQHTNMPVESYDDCVAGWEECLDKMDEL